MVMISRGLPDAAYDRLATKTIADMTGFDSANVFTVTGDVMARFFGLVGSTAITSTSGTTTLALGVTSILQGIITNTTINNTTNFVAKAVWVDTSPTGISDLLQNYGVYSSVNVILTRSVDDITAGALTIFGLWRPLSPGASVVAV